MQKKKSPNSQPEYSLPAVKIGENWVAHWFDPTSILAWRPATYEEIAREKYPNCLDVLDNPRLSVKSSTAAVMAEIAYLALTAEAPVPLSYFTNRGLRYSLTMSRALFYLGCAYDASYKIVALESAAAEVPPILKTPTKAQTGSGFP